MPKYLILSRSAKNI